MQCLHDSPAEYEGCIFVDIFQQKASPEHYHLDLFMNDPS